MSVQALSCAFAMRGLSPSEKLVLLALANFANDKMQCWPSQERLAADTELSARTVWAALKSLEDMRLMSRASRKRADGTRSTDVFTLHFSLEVWSEPLANPAKPTRKPCELQSQSLQEPIAAVARLTTFEPSSTEPDNEPLEGAASAPPKRRALKRVPESWSPAETTIAGLVKEGFTAGDLERALTRMRDHEFRTPRADWDAAFRNWCRRDHDLNPRRADANSPRSDDKLARREANNARAFAGAAAAAGQRWKP